MADRPFASALFAMCAVALLVSGASAQRRPRGGREAKPAAAEPAAPSATAPGTAEPPASPRGDAADAPPATVIEADPAKPAAPTPASEPPAADASAPPAPTAAAVPAAEPSAERKAELTALQQELAGVMDDLVQARTRVAVLGKSLFKTKLRVKVDNRAAPDQLAARVLLWLDGAPIFSAEGSALRDPERALWEGFAAPGPHVLTLEIEQRARDDEAYRYTLRESYRFVVMRERRTDVRLVLDDDSDMAEDFEDDEEGSYEVQTRFEVRAMALNDE